MLNTCEPILSVSFTFTLGRSTNVRVSATLPVLAAKCRAVVPYLFFLVGSAFFSNRNFAVDAILYLLQIQISPVNLFQAFTMKISEASFYLKFHEKVIIRQCSYFQQSDCFIFASKAMPANIYLLKVNNGNTRNISMNSFWLLLTLVSSLLITLNIIISHFFKCFYC